MDRKSELLEKQYNLAINQTDPWYFFLNTADYVKFVKSTNPFKEIVEKLEKEKKALVLELEKKEVKAMKEMKFAKEKLEKLVKKEKGLAENIKKDGFFSDGFTSIDQYLNKKLYTSGMPSDVINRFLHEVAWDLMEKKHSYLLDHFTVEKNDIERKVEFSKALKERQESSRRLDDKRAITPWGYWDFLLLLANDTMFDESWEPLLPNIDQSLNSEYVLVKNEIQGNKKLDVFGRHSTYKPTYHKSKVDTYKHYLSRIHLYLLKEVENTSIKINEKLEFNPETARLNVLGTPVAFRKFGEEFHSLRVIFENKEELGNEWFFSEIGERIDKEKDYTDKKFHNYFSAVKRRVASETGIKDLFLTTNQSVRINNKYLKS